MMKLLFLSAGVLAMLFCGSVIRAQAPFNTMEFVDINNIKAAALVHGDMWWNPVTQQSQCEFPKGSGKNIGFASAIWMSGYDDNNVLHVSAQTYRQSGNDYWPGPLDNSGNLTYATSHNWARIWKVNKTGIDSFRSSSNHTAGNVSPVILQWPAKGNPNITDSSGNPMSVTQDMAPFVDVNGDGIYNALQGDYPAIKGDQALWWVFSDNGPTHSESKGNPIKAEVHVMAYAFKNGTALDNVIYYEYTVLNKSGVNYHNFRVGLFADMDLGYAFDDYIGFDSSHRMGFIYNRNIIDGNGQVNSYANLIPVAGVSIITLPGDIGTNRLQAGSFMYYQNNLSAQGNPLNTDEYNNYLRSTWRDGSHVKNNCSGYDSTNMAPNSNYIFTGNPSDSTATSECKCNNQGGDRRFIITSNDFDLLRDGKQLVVMALITTNPDTNNTCPKLSLNAIKSIADTAWDNYPTTGISNIAATNDVVSIYPNPAHDQISIKRGNTGSGAGGIVIYNSLGQAVKQLADSKNNTTLIFVGDLPAGIYHLLYRKDNLQLKGTFVKE